MPLCNAQKQWMFCFLKTTLLSTQKDVFANGQRCILPIACSSYSSDTADTIPWRCSFCSVSESVWICGRFSAHRMPPPPEWNGWAEVGHRAPSRCFFGIVRWFEAGQSTRAVLLVCRLWLYSRLLGADNWHSFHSDNTPLSESAPVCQAVCIRAETVIFCPMRRCTVCLRVISHVFPAAKLGFESFGLSCFILDRLDKTGLPILLCMLSKHFPWNYHMV